MIIDKKVSIIIPSYNAGGYVKEAVDSALAQTYENEEIIVVDDGSKDNIKEILQPYIDNQKIKYIYQENKGLSGARNTGIKNSGGEYIALLDADDIFLPEKMEKQVGYLENHPDCDICYCGLSHFWDGEPEKLFKLDYQYYSGDEVLPNLVKKDFIAPLTMLIRRSVFDRFGFFDENFRRSEDLEFLFRVLLGGAKICFLNEILAKLRMSRGNNLQGFQSQPEVQKTILSVLENLRGKLSPEQEEKAGLKKQLAFRRFKVGLAYLENENKKGANGYFREAFNIFPLGGVLYLFFSTFLFFVPATFLAGIIKSYHLKKQRNNLTLVK